MDDFWNPFGDFLPHLVALSLRTPLAFFATSGSTFPLEPLGTLGTVWNPLGPFETPLNPFGDILPHLVALFWHFGDFLPNLVALFAASTSLFMVQLHSIASKLYL